MAYYNPKIETKQIARELLDGLLPAWEASYEPGTVSDYLIGYANDEAAAKGAAIAWVTSQTDKDPATLEWVEMPVGDQHDHWYDLIQNHDDGIPTDTGVNVRRRLPATVRATARQAAGQPDTEHPMARALRLGAATIPDEIVAEISESTNSGLPLPWPEYTDRDADVWHLTEETHDGDRVMLPSACDMAPMLRRDVQRLFGPLTAAGQPAADEQRVAELEAEIVQLRDKHEASLRRADQVNNELMLEVQRYAEGTERPVLWSVYNQMHNRALAAEAKLTATPAAGLASPTNHNTETEARGPRSTWRVEGYDADEWNAVSRSFHRPEDAHARKRVSQRYPDMPTRVVRETTTWTVEDDTSAGAES